MDRIATRLNSGSLTIQKALLQTADHFNKIPVSNYLWKIISLSESQISQQISELIKEDFIRPTLRNIGSEDFSQGAYLRTMNVYSIPDQETSELISEIISGSRFLELKKPALNLADIHPGFENLNVETFNPDLTPKMYRCNLLISKSGNYYITRDIFHN